MKSESKFLILLLLLFPGNINAQDTFVSVGIKLGYLWGKGGGSFYPGVEISAVTWGDRSNKLYPFGFTLDYEYISHLKSSRIHLGFEKNVEIFGVDVGPTIVLGEENNFGISIIPYAGFILIPYGEFSIFRGYTTYGTGAYIKVPIRTNTHRFSVGG